MSALRTILNSPYFFWALLAVPSVPLVFSFTQGTMAYGQLMHVSGEFSVRFLVVALMVTPLRVIFANAYWPRWLLARRRYLGVAAFGYAALHTLAYLIELGAIDRILSDAAKLGIWTGWIGFLAFVPLALTSNNFSVRRLGRSWKTLQRVVYFAALFTALHWIFIESSISGALVHFAPLVLLEAYRVWIQYAPSRALVR